MTSAEDAPRIEIVDAMRGIAALAVTWFHLTQGHPGFLPDGWLKSSGALGYLGVHIFFVISGFILCHSLSKGTYTVRNMHRFILKRIVRLDPPYLFSCCLFVALWVLSSRVPGFAGRPYEFSWPQAILHVGYLNGLFGYPWFIPVFWSLAIEFQYYLLVALVFPAVTNRSPIVRVVAITAFCAASLALPSPVLVFHYLALFALGVATFQFRSGMLPAGGYFALLACAALVAAVAQGTEVAIVGVCSALIIAFVTSPGFAPIKFIGAISYSLYLLHVPIGGRVINLGSRFASTEIEKMCVVAFALGLSLATSYLLYRWIELPARGWSSRIRYRG